MAPYLEECVDPTELPEVGFDVFKKIVTLAGAHEKVRGIIP